MSALTEFLLARIAEDEAAAREVVRASPGAWAALPVGLVGLARTRSHTNVLAECEAKRRIVAEHKHAPESQGCCDEHGPVISFMDCDVCVGVGPDYREQGGWCRTLRLLALPYADHPDYRPEWKP